MHICRHIHTSSVNVLIYVKTHIYELYITLAYRCRETFYQKDIF